MLDAVISCWFRGSRNAPDDVQRINGGCAKTVYATETRRCVCPGRRGLAGEQAPRNVVTKFRIEAGRSRSPVSAVVQDKS